MSVTTSHQIQGLKLLDGKAAVIYGAAGGVGTAVAKAFAREGATVFLTGRTENSLKRIADDISSTGGVADVSKVDALSSEAVESHLNRVVAKAGKLDISFNLIGTSVAMGSKLIDLSDQRFAEAAFQKVRSYFITMTAAARIMEKQGNGDRKSTRLNSSHDQISYAVFCLKKKKKHIHTGEGQNETQLAITHQPIQCAHFPNTPTHVMLASSMDTLSQARSMNTLITDHY